MLVRLTGLTGHGGAGRREPQGCGPGRRAGCSLPGDRGSGLRGGSGGPRQ